MNQGRQDDVVAAICAIVIVITFLLIVIGLSAGLVYWVWRVALGV